MAKNIKVGSVTVAGEAYPAIINLAVIMQLQDEGVEIDEIWEDGHKKWLSFAKLICYAINEGCRIAGDPRTVTPDELAGMVDIADLASLADQLATLMTSGRGVEAEAPKN